MKIEYRLAVAPDHMNVGGAMIVRVDDYPETIDSLDRRHYSGKPNRIGFLLARAAARSICASKARGASSSLSSTVRLKRSKSSAARSPINGTTTRRNFAETCVSSKG